MTEELKICLCAHLRKASRRLSQLYDQQLKPSGLRITQFSLLRNLQRLGPVSTSRLAKEMVIDRTTLTRNIKLMSNLNAIRYRRGTDLREKIVEITPQGEKMIVDALPYWRTAQQSVVSQIGFETAQSVLKELSAFVTLQTEKSHLP